METEVNTTQFHVITYLIAWKNFKNRPAFGKVIKEECDS